MTGFLGTYNSTKNSQGRYISTFLNWELMSQKEKFGLLEVYYNNNGLYSIENSQAYWGNAWLEPMKPYRNPVNRSVEFYASKMCQGQADIMISNGNSEVENSIRKFLEWSNFDTAKRPMLRKYALQGTLVTKINFNGDRVWQERIDNEVVTDFVLDSRGHVTEIRMDTPIGNGKYQVEYWTSEDGGWMAIWETFQSANVKIDALGTPKEYHFLTDFGIDFVPFTVAKFKDTGNMWGNSCVEHAILKIDEVNRKHTRMSELLFQYNKPIFAITDSSRDDQGRPYRIKRISKENVNTNVDDSNLFLYVEGAEIKSIIPDLNWADVLAILKSDEQELEKDLPELRYYTLTENQTSGIALRTLLAGALDRANEAQEAFINSQVRATEMALTIGKFFGLFPATIGNFNNGDFKHTMKFAEILPMTSNADKAVALTQIAGIPNMPLDVAMQLAGYEPAEIMLIQNDTVSNS